MHNQIYDVRLSPCKLNGQVESPPSKSVSHRAIICASLCEKPSIIENIAYSEDIIATLEAMKQFGTLVDVLEENEGRYKLQIHNPMMGAFYQERQKPVARPIEIDCKESGSTARFLIPLFHLNESTVTYTGSSRLSERPYAPYYEIFEEQGVMYQTDKGGLPLRIHGTLKAGLYNLVGNVSSQFISGLMFSLPLLEGDSEIRIHPPFESKDYVALTLACLKTFGIRIIEKSEFHYIIEGKQTYKHANYRVEGDYSQAAFWLVASSIGSNIRVTELEADSKQADRAILQVIKASESGTPICIDGSQCPDLVPIITVLCAVTPGVSKITNASRLRLKESDRLKAIATELNKMGAHVIEYEDGLEIVGVSHLTGATVDAWNDHRIAMALAIAATCAEGDTRIVGAQCVRKSYPDFWSIYQKLGGRVDVE